jgi:hypothetical protein
MLDIKVVLVEEAAEIMMPNLIASLLNRNFPCSMLTASHRLPVILTNILNECFYNNSLLPRDDKKELKFSADTHFKSSKVRLANNLYSKGMYFLLLIKIFKILSIISSKPFFLNKVSLNTMQRLKTIKKLKTWNNAQFEDREDHEE